jgi:hypothetical protein
MTRISSLFVASSLVILPLSAFAQPNPAPAKDAAPTAVTTTTTAPVVGKTGAAMAQPAKPTVKDKATETKAQVHGGNSVTTHHAKAHVPAKTVEPLKS